MQVKIEDLNLKLPLILQFKTYFHLHYSKNNNKAIFMSLQRGNRPLYGQ